MSDSLSFTTTSESNRYCKDRLLYIVNSLYVNNMTSKTFRSLTIEGR